LQKKVSLYKLTKELRIYQSNSYREIPSIKELVLGNLSIDERWFYVEGFKASFNVQAEIEAVKYVYEHPEKAHSWNPSLMENELKLYFKEQNAKLMQIKLN